MLYDIYIKRINLFTLGVCLSEDDLKNIFTSAKIVKNKNINSKVESSKPDEILELNKAPIKPPSPIVAIRETSSVPFLLFK